MFDSKKFLDKYCSYEYDYHGTYYEVIGVKYGKVILQDLSSDYSTTIDLADWDAFHSKYVVTEANLEPPSESLQDKLGNNETTNIESIDDLTSAEFRLMQNLY